jgi:nucleoside-diphosphate-sugar epimerase
MKILLFGATGTVGNAVLEACVAAPVVEEVRAITRRPLMTNYSFTTVFSGRKGLNTPTPR